MNNNNPPAQMNNPNLGYSSPQSLKEVVLSFQSLLYDEGDFRKAATYLDDRVSIIDDVSHACSNPSAQSAIEALRSRIQFYPSWQAESLDTIAEVNQKHGAGGKVWLYVRYKTRVCDGELLSVVMFTINQQGKIVNIRGCTQTIKGVPSGPFAP